MQIIDHGLRIYDASTNLPTRGPAFTNLLARSPTLRTSPPVVQHTSSTSYEPVRSISQVWAWNIRTSPLESSQESIKIWTSSLISSRVHHHPWTYSLIAQHLLIQVLHHNIKTKLCKVHTWASLRDSNTSTNLPARGPTLRTSPLVVQLYRPPRP